MAMPTRSPIPPPPQWVLSPPVPNYVTISLHSCDDGSQVKCYLTKLPSWTPPRSEYPSSTDFRVPFDPAVDKDRNGTLKKLFDHVKAAAAKDPKPASRIVYKGKGKEWLYRFAGETIPGELTPQASDPRKAPGLRRVARRWSEFYVVTCEVSWLNSLYLRS